MKKIGITIGDINGIGPEVILKAINNNKWSDDVSFIIIGSEIIIKNQADKLKIPISNRIDFLDVGNASWQPGCICKDASILAASAIKYGIKASLLGEIDGIVTAPIAKIGFKNAGINYPGHTEMFADLTNTSKFGMMLIGGGLRVMLVTRHIALSKVSSSLSQIKIKEAVQLTETGLSWLGIKNKRIGVCGLNPHAGDGGVLGNEEEEIINPALEIMQKKGINVSNAISADTIFYHAKKGDFNAIIAMYHDQGLAPLKMIGFDEGVNLTLGLPIIRTSPDHGTAFTIAGKNKASEKSMKAALELAILLSRKKNPWT